MADTASSYDKVDEEPPAYNTTTVNLTELPAYNDVATTVNTVASSPNEEFAGKPLLTASNDEATDKTLQIVHNTETETKISEITCKKSHLLQYTSAADLAQTSDDYKDGFRCNECSLWYWDANSYHCKPCLYDMCSKCHSYVANDGRAAWIDDEDIHTTYDDTADKYLWSKIESYSPARQARRIELGIRTKDNDGILRSLCSLCCHIGGVIALVMLAIMTGIALAVWYTTYNDWYTAAAVAGFIVLCCCWTKIKARMERNEPIGHMETSFANDLYFGHYDPSKNTQICLFNKYWKYVCVENNGYTETERLNYADSRTVSTQFNSIPIGENKVALQSIPIGKYVTAASFEMIYAKSADIGPHQKFQVIKHENGTFSFKGDNNKYLAAKRPGAEYDDSCMDMTMKAAERCAYWVYVVDAPPPKVVLQNACKYSFSCYWKGTQAGYISYNWNSEWCNQVWTRPTESMFQIVECKSNNEYYIKDAWVGVDDNKHSWNQVHRFGHWLTIGQKENDGVDWVRLTENTNDRATWKFIPNAEMKNGYKIQCYYNNQMKGWLGFQVCQHKWCKLVTEEKDAAIYVLANTVSNIA